MDAVRVVVCDVVPEQTPEVTFPENEDLVEKLSPAVPNPSFGNRVLPGTPVSRAHRNGAEPPNGRRDSGGEDRVAAVEEEARGPVSRKGLPELLATPMET